jgi:hypothetical protein
MASVEEIVAKLTGPQKRALIDSEPDMFDYAQVVGHGRTMAALRRSGIVEGKHRTDLGNEVAQQVLRG